MHKRFVFNQCYQKSIINFNFLFYLFRIKLILFNEQFSEVEKIKTIGSTYMAATGLRSKHDSVYGVSNYLQVLIHLSS